MQPSSMLDEEGFLPTLMTVTPHHKLLVPDCAFICLWDLTGEGQMVPASPCSVSSLLFVLF